MPQANHRVVPPTAEDFEMLCLAALPYRGFHDVDPTTVHADRLHAAVVRGLDEIECVRGRWQVVWGPVAYRAPLSMFDDGVVYVVRSLTRPSRYVVGVRGTNPVSVFDWLLGDFWVGQQIAWPFGDPVSKGNAKISLSTALGLSVIRHMRGIPHDVTASPAAGLGGTLRHLVQTALPAGFRSLASMLAALGDAARERLESVRSRLWRALDEIPKPVPLDAVEPTAAQITALVKTWQAVQRSATFQLVADAVDAVDDRFGLDTLVLLDRDARWQSELAEGVDLLTFLATQVEQADDDVEVTVAGHSKGGGLASTIALWLADTQGTSFVDPTQRWDARHKATVRCFSFAGPTAGNAAFAAHSDRVIGERCRRVTNPLDVVTLAWQAADVDTIATLYPGVHVVPGLAELATVIKGQVETLDYRHVGNLHVPLQTAVDPTRRLFLPQALHQHLEAYLQALGGRDAASVVGLLI